MSQTLQLPTKPAYRTGECNGCGLWCMVTPCPGAIQLFGLDKRQGCPMVEWADGRFWCGLLRSRQTYMGRSDVPTEAAIKKAMGIGTHCDCDRPEGQTVIDAFDPTKDIS